MNANGDIPRMVRSWIREEEDDSADRVLQVVLASLDTTPQHRPLWPVRRNADMSTIAKLGGLAAAVIVVVVGGMALMSRGDIGLDPTAAPSPAPTLDVPTGASPATTPQASAAASLPGEFTACVPENREARAGTNAKDVVPGADGDVTIDRMRGYTWRGAIIATDPRFEGTHYYSWGGDTYTLASGDKGQTTWSEGHRIENDGGSWRGSASGITWPDGTTDGGPVVLIGEGGYAGLTALLVVATDSPCFFDWRGIVTEIPDAPVPFTGD